MKTKELFMYLLATLATLVFLTLVVIVFFVSVPDPNRDLANFLLGQFAAIVTMVYSYFFGSSKSSADKTEADIKVKEEAATKERERIEAEKKVAEELAKNSVIKTTEQIETKIN